MKFKNLSKLGLILGLVISFVACSEDDSVDNPDNGNANATEVYITDSPVDQANVEAVFITVSEVSLNGKAIEGFNKTTLEISSLTQGRTKMLGELNLESGTTSNLVLKLSETAASGNGPGNYVVLQGGAKQEIGGNLELNLNDQVEILEDTRNKVVFDFDLRKSIKSQGDSFSFVSESQLESSVRAVNEARTGIVSGSVENSSEANADVVVAYAYKKGAFSESDGNANSEGIRFANAVSSSVVSNNQFEIHFLEEGDYELHFASYSDNDNDGKLEFTGMVDASATGALQLNGFTVESNSEVNLQIAFTGLLGL